ncbi:LexA family protein [Hymenobacter jeollabukensis]|uniref:Translesion error-prone DNA polymerase V autoproteolytic subunit n=1 Tax=Hymenobacter jeollabukensis TaxID=2025313 RepID=A0A5R8WIW8_9BACT|nr:translesion error-prone DNA polymerase V autoproteolytic subunit [Hymenobacter jeollabukensis]TLM88818.1 translesion error-prone DNA polymerase V autoproteolytic subunit [Hymenobacter jeollabukensis]
MDDVEILGVAHEPVWLIECDTRVPAGFPSPAADYAGEKVNLSEILLPHPDCTYLARVAGESMAGPPSHIPDGALLAVDCAIEARSGHVIVAAVEDGFTVKRLEYRGSQIWLVPDNPAFPPRQIHEQDRFRVWGVVTHVVTELIHGKLHQHVRTRNVMQA